MYLLLGSDLTKYFIPSLATLQQTGCSWSMSEEAGWFWFVLSFEAGSPVAQAAPGAVKWSVTLNYQALLILLPRPLQSYAAHVLFVLNLQSWQSSAVIFSL